MQFVGLFMCEWWERCQQRKSSSHKMYVLLYQSCACSQSKHKRKKMFYNTL
jgi:hypothetical protein